MDGLPATRDECSVWDAADPVGGFLDRFEVPDPEVVYLDGNSLGRLPKATVERLRHVVVEEWGRGLVGSWDTWIDDTTRVGDLIGTSFLGARAGETLVADSTTVNLYKLLSAACADRPGAVVVARTEFPTDRYVAGSVAEQHGRPLVTSLEEAGGPVAVAVVSVVDYRSGLVADVADETSLVHAAGGLAVWDCSHAVGSIELHLREWGADLATGCSYKHLCGGPGAPAWLWVRDDLQSQLRQPVRGWFGQHDQFAMDEPWRPLDGIRSWASGTPPVLALAALEEGARLVAAAGIAATARRARRLGDLAIALADEVLTPHGCTVASPRDARVRGAHVALRHPHAAPLTLALRARGVVPDLRPPDVVRIGLSPLTTRATDVWDGMHAMADVLDSGAWRPFEGAAARVT